MREKINSIAAATTATTTSPYCRRQKNDGEDVRVENGKRDEEAF